MFVIKGFQFPEFLTKMEMIYKHNKKEKMKWTNDFHLKSLSVYQKEWCMSWYIVNEKKCARTPYQPDSKGAGRHILRFEGQISSQNTDSVDQCEESISHKGTYSHFC